MAKPRSSDTTCTIRTCANERLPNSTWCAVHKQLFIELGREKPEPDDKPHVPSFVASRLGKPDPAPVTPTRGRPQRNPADVRPAAPMQHEATADADTYPELRYCGSCHQVKPRQDFDTRRERPHSPLNFTCRRCEAMAEGAVS